jgi:hypothetical protein
LDRIISDRLARDRQRYADYDELKRKAAEHDKALEASRTEQEKAVEAARREGESAATERANTRLVSAEARAVAAELRFRNPALAVRSIDLSGVTVSDTGEVDSAALRSRLGDLKTAEPYLVDDGKPTPPKPDPSQGGGGREDKPSVSSGAELFAQRRNRKSA